MKLFDPRAALAEIRNQNGPPATIATTATQTPIGGPNVANVAIVATPQSEIPKIADQPEQPLADDMRHGFAVNGSPRTWDGNIVSLEDWRKLSEWQKHGPNGRMWCAVCRAWVIECKHIKEQQR